MTLLRALESLQSIVKNTLFSYRLDLYDNDLVSWIP